MEPEIVVDSRDNVECKRALATVMNPGADRGEDAPSERSMRQLGLPPSLISALLERSSAR
jgi:hypothetical protein